MRILHVNKFLYRRGGAESYMSDVAALQGAAGDTVEYFGMAHPDNDPSTYADRFPRNVELDPVPPGARAKLAAASRMLWSRSSARGIAAVLDDFRPDVVHFHNIYHQLSPSIVRPTARRGIAMVMTLHDYKLACPTYQLLDHDAICEACIDTNLWAAPRRRCKDGSLGASALLAGELALHRALGAYDPISALICPSRFMLDTMTRAGIERPARLRHLPHFVETAGIDPKTTPGGGLAFVGRLSREKGVDVLLRAVAALDPAAPLVLAGDGPERAALERLRDELGLSSTTFVGRLPKEGVEALLRSSLAMVLPARWHENQPMSILEAFALGVPVVSTAVGGIGELVDEAVGRVVPHDDVTALSEALEHLLADPIRAFEQGRAARAIAETRFSPSAHLRGLAEIYEGAGACAS
jgi:glycosyltransferase involved in cell wall biosynthesis